MGSSPDAGHYGPPPDWPRRRIIPAIWEAAVTEPRGKHDDRQTGAATADREPEVRPEVIADLDIPGDDADVMGGGLRSDTCCERISMNTN
jgi:hypothetical protein